MKERWVQTAMFTSSRVQTMSVRLVSESRAPEAVVLVRLAVGAVFLSEGIQKFLYPTALGVGRFTKIGIPMPAVSAPFVGVVEIVCGALVILGLATRLAALLLVVDMLVAIATTKVPILLSAGFWAMAHEARVDFTMLLGSLFLILVGAGPWALDAKVIRPSPGVAEDGALRARTADTGSGGSARP